MVDFEVRKKRAGRIFMVGGALMPIIENIYSSAVIATYSKAFGFERTIRAFGSSIVKWGIVATILGAILILIGYGCFKLQTEK